MELPFSTGEAVFDCSHATHSRQWERHATVRILQRGRVHVHFDCRLLCSLELLSDPFHSPAVPEDEPDLWKEPPLPPIKPGTTVLVPAMPGTPMAARQMAQASDLEDNSDGADQEYL